MAKTKGKIDQITVDQLRGVLDFYPRGNETIIRTWPRNKGNSQTPRSVAWIPTFNCFHINFRPWRFGLDLSYFQLVLLHEWTMRDYLMSRWYGNVSPSYNLKYDTRDPFPPPCPDPLQRFFLAHPVRADYTLDGRLRIIHRVFPPYHRNMFWYDTPPSMLHQYRTTRGVRCQVGTDFIPAGNPDLLGGMSGYSDPVANFYSWRYAQLGKPYFYFYATRWYQEVIGGKLVRGPWGVTVSPWYYVICRPGPGGGPLGATVEGPHLFTENAAKVYQGPLA